MAGKKKRGRPHKKGKHTMYKTTNRREQNKAMRVARNLLKSADPVATWAKIKSQLPDTLMQYTLKVLKAKKVV